MSKLIVVATVFLAALFVTEIYAGKIQVESLADRIAGLKEKYPQIVKNLDLIHEYHKNNPAAAHAILDKHFGVRDEL